MKRLILLLALVLFCAAFAPANPLPVPPVHIAPRVLP